MTPLFPEPYHQTIIDILTDAERPTYADVATVDSQGRPHVRTVHLRYFQEFMVVGFACNTNSPKWRQMEQQPSIAVCYYDQKRQLELRWEGRVFLISEEDANSVQKIRRHSWGLMQERLRQAYWDTCAKKATHSGALCPAMGFVQCTPELWDIYDYAGTDPSQARTIFTLDGSTWTPQSVSIIDSHPLT